MTRLAAAVLICLQHALRTQSYPVLGDYMPVSNVHEHAQIVKDVLAFNEALKGSPPGYAKAKHIYRYGGGDSCKTATSPRTLYAFATKDLTGESYADKFYGSGFSKTFWDKAMLDALDGTGALEGADDTKRVTSAKKMALGLVTYYASHELEAAIDKLEAGKVDDSKGAPHAWDEGWAFYHGSENGAGSPWEVAKKRDADFPSAGALNVTMNIDEHFNKGLHLVRDGTSDQTKATEAMNTIYKMWTVTYLRAGLKYLEISEKTYQSKAHAEGYAYYMAIDGFVASYDAAAASAMRDALLISKTLIAAGTFCAAQAKIFAALPKIGLTCKDIGTFKDSTIQCEQGCEASATSFPEGMAKVAAVAGEASDVACAAAAQASAEGNADDSAALTASFSLVSLAISSSILAR